MKPYLLRTLLVLSIFSAGFGCSGCSSAPKTSYRQQSSSNPDPLAPPAKKEQKIDWSDSIVLTAISSLAFWTKNPSFNGAPGVPVIVTEK